MNFFADNACAWDSKPTIDNRVGQLSPVLYPQRAIESPVLDRFAYMFGGDFALACRSATVRETQLRSTRPQPVCHLKPRSVGAD